MEQGRDAAAVRLLDLTLILARHGGDEHQRPELAAACAPLLARVAAQRVAATNESSVMRQRRSLRLRLPPSTVPALLQPLPAVSELICHAGSIQSSLQEATRQARAAFSGLKLVGALTDWPALFPRSVELLPLAAGWATSLDTLRAAIGHRTVPIEVGIRAGAAAGRQQRLVLLDDFLTELSHPSSPMPSHGGGVTLLALTPVVPVTAANTTGYLAQFQVFLSPFFFLNMHSRSLRNAPS